MEEDEKLKDLLLDVGIAGGNSSLEARAKFKKECDEIRELLARPSPGSTSVQPSEDGAADEEAPAMPVISSYSGGHREKLSDLNIELLGLVARPVKPAEIMTNPKAKKAVGDEWDKLRKKYMAS